MSNQIAAIVKTSKKNSPSGIKKSDCVSILNADALFAAMRSGFDKVEDHRSGKVQHSLSDTLMSDFAMSSLKDPLILAFDERRFDEPYNLKTIYGMKSIPCDTSMREILDGVTY